MRSAAFEQASQHATPAGANRVAFSWASPQDSPLRLFMSSTEDLLVPSDTRMMSLWLVWSTLMRPLKPRPVLRNLQAGPQVTVHAGGSVEVI